MSTSPVSQAGAAGPGTKVLADRRALVIGGTRGMSAAIAQLLAARGAHVIVTARHREDRERALSRAVASMKLVKIRPGGRYRGGLHVVLRADDAYFTACCSGRPCSPGQAWGGTRLQGHPGDHDDDGRHGRRHDRSVGVRVPEHPVAEEAAGGHADHGPGQAPRRGSGEPPTGEAAGQVDVGGGKGRGGNAWHVEEADGVRLQPHRERGQGDQEVGTGDG